MPEPFLELRLCLAASPNRVAACSQQTDAITNRMVLCIVLFAYSTLKVFGNHEKPRLLNLKHLHDAWCVRERVTGGKAGVTGVAILHT